MQHHKPAARAKTAMFDRPDGGGGLEEETSAKAELVIPIDFERRLTLPEVTSDPLAQQVLTFPENDVMAEVERRVSRIAFQQPRKEDLGSLPVHVRDCLDVATRDWVVVKHAHSYYARTVANINEGKEPTFVPQTYEIDLVAAGGRTEDSGAKSFEAELTRAPSRESRAADVQQRKQDRRPVFEYFKDFERQVVSNDRRARPSPPMDLLGHCFHVSVKELKFQLAEIEPFWCTLCVYDIRTKRKVTEDFHFDMNSEAILRQLKGRPAPADSASKALEAVFSLSHCSADYYLVLRIAKLLTGETDKVLEPYFKAAQMKPKEMQKLQQEIASCCERLANFAQPFAIGAVPLFARSPDSANNEKAATNNASATATTTTTGTTTTTTTTTTTAPATPMTNDAFLYTNAPLVVFSYLARYTEQIGEDNIDGYVTRLVNEKERKSKLKIIPGRAAVEIRVISATHEDPTSARLDPSLFSVLPQPDKPLRVVRELQEFHQDHERLVPYLSFVHHLYVYPQSVNFTHFLGSAKHRNVSVNVRLKLDDRQLTDAGVRKLHGRSNMPALVTELNSVLSYHDEKPQFCDEFKIELPQALLPQHHVLFTFQHVVCQEPGKKAKDFTVAMPCAVVALPVYNPKTLSLLPDAVHTITPYLSLPPHYLGSGTEHVPATDDDDVMKPATKQPAFVVRTRLVSSIYAQDAALNHFFNRYDSGRDDRLLVDAVRGLVQMQKHVCVRFLPVILNQLFRLMQVASDATSQAAFQALFHVLQQTQLSSHEGNTEASRSPLLLSYVHYIFDVVGDAQKYLYEVIPREFVLLLKDRPDFVTDYAVRYSWFVFDIVHRSLALKCADRNELTSDRNRTERFSAVFYELTEALLGSLAREVQLRMHTGATLARELNKNVAFFIKDLANIVDRGRFFQLVRTYGTLLTASANTSSSSSSSSNASSPSISSPSGTPSTDTNLLVFKFMFLRILSDHEHFVPLNLPLPEHTCPPIAALLSHFWSRHFLVSFLLFQLDQVQLHPDRTARIGAIAVLRSLLVRHDVDPRYQTPEVRQRILAMYLPFLTLLLDPSSSVVQKARDKEKDELQHWLVCFLHLVTGTDRRLLRDWWRKETQKKTLALFIVLARCLDVFEYTGAAELTAPAIPPASAAVTRGDSSSGVAPLLPSQSAALLLGEAADLERAYDDPMGVRRQTQQNTMRRHAAARHAKRTTAVQALSVGQPQALSRGTVLEQNLTREVSLVVLELLADFAEDLEADLEREQSVFARNYMEVLLLLLKKNQPHGVLTQVLRLVRNLIFTFSKQLFRYNTSFVGELTYEILRLCTFHDARTRAESAAIFYALCRRNNDEMQNFARMKLQSTIAISKLVGEGQISDDGVLFTKALEAIRAFTRAEDASRHSDFMKQLEELLERLHSVLKSSRQIDAFKYDPEQTADLYYEISKGYTDSPDLRVTWLENLATLHRQKENYFEAAQCRIHISALVSEYLKLVKPSEAIHVDRAAFQRLSPNIAEDMSIPPGVSRNESICQSAVFSRKGLFDNLFEAVGLLKQSDLFESAIEVERFMAAIHKKNRNYAKLSECYGELTTFCERIVQANSTNARLFSLYYRVAFFGDLLPEQNGKEYVYKEHPMVRLADMTERLKAQYTGKLGPNKVQVLPNKPVDKATLAPGILYLQVVSVEEYLEPHELKERRTPFERKFNLQRFIFETPFTTTGKAQGDFKEQCKRKTILTTDLPFPYVKKRILVKQKREITLSPIETSTEIIEGRVTALKTEVERPNASTKTLQIVLQGSVLLQVNAGPLEICRIFLGNAKEFPAEHVARLRSKMAEFVRLCHAGVQLNRRLITAEQKELQEKLEEGYMDLLKKVEPYQLGELPTFVLSARDRTSAVVASKEHLIESKAAGKADHRQVRDEPRASRGSGQH